MAKVVLFSDLHAHPFKPYATILPNGMNSRLENAVSCIAQIVQYCKQEKVDLVLFGGDLFHVRRNISVPAFNAVYEAMSGFAEAGIPVVLIHGNHDQADKHGNDHSIHALRTFLTVVDEPGWVTITGGESKTRYDVLAVPYTENVDQLKEVLGTRGPDNPENPTILLGHLGVQGARVGADFVYSNPHDPVVDTFDGGRFDIGFLGHFHEHQQLNDRLWYIGAALHHNWGDKNTQRGFLVLETDTLTFEQVPLSAPRFVELEIHGTRTKNIPDLDGDFVRVVSKRAWSKDRQDRVKEMWGCASLEVVPPRGQASTTKEARIEFRAGASFEDMVRQYVESGLPKLDGLDESYLIQIGQEMLREAEAS